MKAFNKRFEFSKLHGTGNDFVLVEKEKLPADINLPDFAREVCDRKSGIGSDGLLILAGHFDADFEMIMYNPDGSEAEMCGNGIRCVGKYIYDNGLRDEDKLRIKTGAGILRLKLRIDDNNKVDWVEVAMGKPDFTRQNIPVTGKGETALVENIKINDDLEVECHCVSMGNPHAVVLVDDLDNYPVETIGPKIETHEIFPNRTNVEFVQHLSSESIKVRFWERGADETLSCGTGVCAAAAVVRKLNLVGILVNVDVPGGSLSVKFDEEDAVYLGGPCVEVFKGIVTDE